MGDEKRLSRVFYSAALLVDTVNKSPYPLNRDQHQQIRNMAETLGHLLLIQQEMPQPSARRDLPARLKDFLASLRH